VHINRRKKTKVPKELSTNGNGAIQQSDNNNNNNNENVVSSDIPAVGNQETENGHAKKSVESNPEMKISSVVSSSPYPNVCNSQLSLCFLLSLPFLRCDPSYLTMHVQWFKHKTSIS